VRAQVILIKILYKWFRIVVMNSRGTVAPAFTYGYGYYCSILYQRT